LPKKQSKQKQKVIKYKNKPNNVLQMAVFKTKINILKIFCIVYYSLQHLEFD